MAEPAHITEAPDLKVVASTEQSSKLSALGELIDAFVVVQAALQNADPENDDKEYHAYVSVESAIIEYPCRTLDDVQLKARFFLEHSGPYDSLRNCINITTREGTLLAFLRSLGASDAPVSTDLQRPPNQGLSVATIPQLALAFETYKAAATLFGGTLSTPLFGGNGDEMMERSFEQAHEAMSAISDELQKRSPATQRESDIRRTVLVLRNLDCGEPINPPLENDTARTTGQYLGDGEYEGGSENWNGGYSKYQVRLRPEKIDGHRSFEVKTQMDRMILSEPKLNTFIRGKVG